MKYRFKKYITMEPISLSIAAIEFEQKIPYSNKSMKIDSIDIGSNVNGLLIKADLIAK